MDQNALFQSLVSNAIDFFEQAIGDVESNPKYSVIHFFAGLEILLKSRLLLEHWTLVYDEPQNANPERFIKGDFRSVAFDESIRRLRTITKTPILQRLVEALIVFRNNKGFIWNFYKSLNANS
jgi:hypothetical protein